MSIEHKRRILDLLEEALEVPSAERNAYLDEHCEDEATRREVEAMLATEPHSEILGAPVFSIHDEDAAVGRRIGSYEIVRLLDRGGMGSVYLAEREDFDQQVALKLLRRGLDLDDTLVRRFHNERQILAHLDHPNIAKLLDGGTTEDRLPYFVMELVDGVPIDRYCEQHDLSIEERLRLFRKVCAAVQFAHRNLVVHRDLKPSNVLITADGEPKLLDFGIAKLLDDGMAALTLDTAPGHGAMTPRYASPEQIRLEPVTTASDVYSLGVLLYELLTGRTPYRLETDRSDEVARAVCEQEPEKPSTAVRRRGDESSDETPRSSGETLRDPHKLRQLLAGDLDSIVLKALRKRPEMRYGSVEQFSEDVHRYLSGLPVEAREGTGLYRFGKFVRRNKLPLAVVTGFVLLILGFGVASWQLRQEAVKAQQEAVKAQQKADALSVSLWSLLYWFTDPDITEGGKLTQLEILREAKDDILEKLVVDPETEINVTGSLGELFRKLGDLEESQTQMKRSLAASRAFYGEDHPDVAKRVNNLSVVLTDLGKFSEAEDLLRQALETRQKLGQDEQDLFRLRSNLANVLMLKGEYEASEDIHLQNLRARESFYGPTDTDVATSLRNLGALYIAAGQFEEAEKVLSRAMTIRKDAYGLENTKVASVLNLLGIAKSELGKTEEAEDIFEQALRVRLELLGELHPDVARTRTNLGALLINEDPKRARNLLETTIENLRESHQEGRELAEAESVYGELLVSQGELEGAEVLLLESYRRLVEVRGPDSLSTREARQRILDLYKKWGRPEKLADFLATSPPDDPEETP